MSATPNLSNPAGTIGLDLEDFRRLGVRPYECRLTVIRQAASRSAKALAERQLTRPSQEGEIQLSRVATSAYRLLDPRQRDDSTQRVHIGRILPSALAWASDPHFHGGGQKPPAARSESPFASNTAPGAGLVEPGNSPLSIDTTLAVSDKLSADDLLSPWARRIRRIRRKVHHPLSLVAMVTLMVGATLGLAQWRASSDPSAISSTTTIDESASDKQLAASAGASDSAPAVNPERSPSAAELAPHARQKADSSEGVTAPIELADATNDGAGTEPLEMIPMTGRAEGLPMVAVDAVDRSTEMIEPASGALAKPHVTEPPVTEPQPEATGETTPRSSITDIVNSDPENPTNQVDDVLRPSVAMPDSEAIAMLDPSPADGTPEGEFLADPFETLAEMSDSDDDTEATAVAPDSSVMSDEPLARTPEPRELERPAVPTDDQMRDARAGIVLLLPELSGRLSPEQAVAQHDQIRSMMEDFATGTSEHWAAQLMLVELAWLFEDAARVTTRIDRWVGGDRDLISSLLATTYAGAHRYAESNASHQHLLHNGLVLAEQLLLRESLSECEEVVEAAQASADLLQDDDSARHLEQFSQSVEQMGRLSDSTRRAMFGAGQFGEVEHDHGIAGRYLCLMLRRWDIGLPWLVETSNRRIAGIARQESSLPSDATSEQRVEIAERWLAGAEHSSGRAADSIRLHALELLRGVENDLSGLQKLQVERRIDELEVSIPFYLTPQPIEKSILNQPTSQSALPAAEPSENTLAGLSGRLSVEGVDLGVQLNYTTGMPINQDVLEQIATRTSQNLDAVTIEMTGEFQLDQAGSVQVTISDSAVKQKVWIDDQIVVFDPMKTDSKVGLDEGKHLIRWTFQPDDVGVDYLRVQRSSSGEEIEMTHPSRSGRLPVRTVLTVNMIRPEDAK